ncbi:MAG TPA: CHAT domain-containing tetratricopeptide repeat protein [Pyrinomonadaceae bacterium]|nr:CHAT domain-containing tetratricopeptide repeat protein [Pyrinomonadaceae bacterium]
MALELINTEAAAEREALLGRNQEQLTGGLVAELQRQGRAREDRREYAAASKIYDLALNIAERLGDKARILEMIRAEVTIRYRLKEYEQGLKYAERGLKEAEEISDKSSTATILRMMGSIYYAQRNDALALEFYRKSLALKRELDDKIGIADGLYDVGFMLRRQGNNAEAMEALQSALAILQEVKDKQRIANTLNLLSGVYRAQGDYIRGLESLQTALALAEEGGNKFNIANSLNNIGLFQSNLGNFTQALSYYQKSLAVRQEIGDKKYIALTLNSIGNAYYALDDYAPALEAHRKSLALSQELQDQSSIANSINNMGAVYYAQGDYSQALEHFQKTLKMKEEVKDQEGVAGALINIGQSYQKLGKYGLALEAADRAASISSKFGLKEFLHEARTTAGQAHLVLNEPELARKAFIDAIDTIEDLRGRLGGGEETQQRYFERKVSAYYSMVDLLVSQKDFSQALTYAERAKGRVLLDVLRSGRGNVTKAMTPEEINRDRALASELASLNTQFSAQKQQAKPDAALLADLNARLEKARLQYEEFRTNLYIAHPELKVRRGEYPLLTLDEAAKLLPDDKTALLEYVVGEEKSYLFVLKKAAGTERQHGPPVTLTIYPLDVKSKELEDLAGDFLLKIGERNLTIKKDAEHLYDLLIKPGAEQLRGVRKLCIVPDGPLWNLPFQALHQGAKGYLLEQYAIYYAPSLSVLREMLRKGRWLRTVEKRPAAPRMRKTAATVTARGTGANFQPELFGIGNPTANVEATTKVKSLYREETLDPLPDAQREVTALAQLYGPTRSRLLVGTDAQEEVVKAEAGQYQVLHFATHAILDDRNPMYSKVILSHSGRETQEDGMLETWEIMKLDLAADLVVLSACQTARGRVGAGEGMVGMSWALFVAGAPSVVVSQWKVDSARTADLMINFHRNLMSKGADGKPAMTKSEALREAALKLLHGTYNHPAYWAGFVLIGDER